MKQLLKDTRELFKEHKPDEHKLRRNSSIGTLEWKLSVIRST